MLPHQFDLDYKLSGAMIAMNLCSWAYRVLAHWDPNLATTFRLIGISVQ